MRKKKKKNRVKVIMYKVIETTKCVYTAITEYLYMYTPLYRQCISNERVHIIIISSSRHKYSRYHRFSLVAVVRTPC